MSKKKGGNDKFAPILKRIRVFKDIEKRDNVYTARLIKIRKSLKYRLRRKNRVSLHH